MFNINIVVVVIFDNILSCRLRHVRNIYPGSTCKEITFQIERHRTELSAVQCVEQTLPFSFAPTKVLFTSKLKREMKKVLLVRILFCLDHIVLMLLYLINGNHKDI